MILLCPAASATANRKTARHLKKEREIFAQRGVWFLVFITGATQRKPSGLLRIMQRHFDIVTLGNVEDRLVLIELVQHFEHRGPHTLRRVLEGDQFAKL